MSKQTTPIQSFAKAAGQLFDENGSFGSGTLISPKLFLTAGHCVLHEIGEYVLKDGGDEEYKVSKPVAGKSRDELMEMSKKELAAFMTEQNLKYNLDVKMDDICGTPVREINQGLTVSFYNEDGEEVANIGGKVLCGVRTDDYSMDFALIELDEPVNDIKTPELSTQVGLERGFIFHYPRGGERVISAAHILKPISAFHEFKLTYRADTKDQSSGSSILSESGRIVGIHTDRDLLADEIAALATGDENEDLDGIEKHFAETDGKFVHGVPIVEILNFRSEATEIFINALAANGVKIDGRIPAPITRIAQAAAEKVSSQQQSIKPITPNL